MNNNTPNHSHFAAYLTGLIEGDGHISVLTKGYVTCPRITIGTHRHNLPFLKSLGSVFNKAPILRRREHAATLTISKKSQVFFLISLLNGNMRTGKIEQLHAAIDYVNTHYGTHFIKLPKSTVPLGENAWFSGFIDADGCFKIAVRQPRPRGEGKHRQVLCEFDLIQSTKNAITKETNKELMQFIADFLDTRVYSSSTKKTLLRDSYDRYQILVSSQNAITTLVSYLERYPLYSSKRNDYDDWKKAIDAMRRGLHKNTYDYRFFTDLKDQMNSKRVDFDWSHLDDFKKITNMLL